MSLACGRNCIVDRPRAPVFLNLYAILVAESGITRKSSAVKAAAKIAHMLLEDDPHIGLLEAKITPEKLDEQLHRRTAEVGSAQLAVAISELAVFLGVERYVATMPALLTDLYDCSAHRSGGGSISRGALKQENIFVSFLSASTPSWLLRSVNPNVVEGGFTSRCMFVLSEQPKRRIAWPTAKADDSVNTSALADHLRRIRSEAKQCKTITLTDAAKRTLELWYRRRKVSYDAFRSSFESREDAHVLRLAAFLAINDSTWVVQVTHLKLSIRIIESVKLNASRLFAGTNQRTKFVLGVEACRDALIACGTEGTTRAKLFLKVRRHLDNAEFLALLDVMHEIGVIQRFEYRDGGKGRPVDIIRGTKLLTAKGMAEKLVERM